MTTIEPLARLHVTRDVTEARRAREWATDVLTGRADLDGPRTADAVVMLSELVTNVISHTDGEATITIELSDGRVRVGVEDDDDRPPRVLAADPMRLGGNGMRIIDAWADAWGVDRAPGGGKTVWFELTLGRPG